MLESMNEKLGMAARGDLDAVIEIAEDVLWSDDEPIEEGVLRRVKDMLADAVDRGSGEAMRIVGDMYFNGRGVDKDLDKAAFWYDKAAEIGVHGAVEKLKEAKPDEIDHEKLFKDYAKAAMAGDPMGYYRIGEMYEKGDYVPHSDQEAFNCFVLAHQLGCRDKSVECYPDICMKVGEYLYKGKGVERSTLEAKNFFEEASDHYRMQYNKGDDSKLAKLRWSQEVLDDVNAVMGSGCNGII